LSIGDIVVAVTMVERSGMVEVVPALSSVFDPHPETSRQAAISEVPAETLNVARLLTSAHRQLVLRTEFSSPIKAKTTPCKASLNPTCACEMV
jgi:hypothetical protein